MNGKERKDLHAVVRVARAAVGGLAPVITELPVAATVRATARAAARALSSQQRDWLSPGRQDRSAGGLRGVAALLCARLRRPP